MRSGRHSTWLGLTPEPERELPAAVATLRRGRQRRTGETSAPATEASHEHDTTVESRRIEHVILHGSQRAWLRYLDGVTALVVDAAAHATSRSDQATALHAAQTVLDHHRMLIGLPGPAYERVAPARQRLAGAVALLRERLGRP